MLATASYTSCSASLGSHSGSVPHSASVMSGSLLSSVSTAVFFLPADSPEAVGGPSKLSREDKNLLLEYFGIDCKLPYLEPPGLPSSSQKYKAITEATPHVIALSKDQEWKQQFGNGRAWVHNVVDFINIFIAK